MLDALGKKTGPEDIRSPAQRDHDALEEACHRLIAAGNLPDRAGQPTRIQLHITLDDLVNGPAGGRPGPRPGQPGSREAARLALFPNGDDLTRPQPGGWTGPGPLATPGDLCDASIVPIVTGHVDHELLGKLAADLLSHACGSGSSAGPFRGSGPLASSGPFPNSGPGPASAGDPDAPGLGAGYARELILRNAVALLSGPTGLASRLRTSQLHGPAAAISLPLDCGAATETIPPHLRRAVIRRDVHCGFPGCTNRDCQVHHIVPVSEGGATSLENLTLGCLFHHLIAIHTWGWKLLLNADGTKTAISPDGTRILHSHDPPRAA